MTDRERAEARARELCEGICEQPVTRGQLMSVERVILEAEQRGKQEGRREALEEAAKIVSEARFGERDSDLRSIYHAIRALATPAGGKEG